MRILKKFTTLQIFSTLVQVLKKEISKLLFFEIKNYEGKNKLLFSPCVRSKRAFGELKSIEFKLFSCIFLPDSCAYNMAPMEYEKCIKYLYVQRVMIHLYVNYDQNNIRNHFFYFVPQIYHAEKRLEASQYGGRKVPHKINVSDRSVACQHKARQNLIASSYRTLFLFSVEFEKVNLSRFCSHQ